MLKVRIIPVLTFNGFGLVKTKKFANPRMVGNPVQAARVYNNRGVDELVFIDINATAQKRKINLKVVSDVIKECYMPVAIGGGIATIEDINDLLKIGADKVIIKTKALIDIEFIKNAVAFFGSQCICISIDAYWTENGYYIFNNIGINKSLDDFIQEMISCEVGEFLLISVDHDGMMDGFDLKLVNHVQKQTNIPIIAIGGGGDVSHYYELFKETKIQAVASASLFHFTQFTPLDVKKELKTLNIPVRI